MRDRDYEEDTATMPMPGQEEQPLRYILFTGDEYDKIGGAVHQHSIHPTIIEAADVGEREYLMDQCQWFNALDVFTLNTYDQEELQRLTSERNHREAEERVRAYKEQNNKG